MSRDSNPFPRTDPAARDFPPSNLEALLAQETISPRLDQDPAITCEMYAQRRPGRPGRG